MQGFQDQSSGARFYSIVQNELRAAMLGQYGEGISPDGFRKLLEGEATAFGVTFRNSAFILQSQDCESMLGLVDTAVSKFSLWVAAGRPAIQ